MTGVLCATAGKWSMESQEIVVGVVRAGSVKAEGRNRKAADPDSALHLTVDRGHEQHNRMLRTESRPPRRIYEWSSGGCRVFFASFPPIRCVTLGYVLHASFAHDPRRSSCRVARTSKPLRFRETCLAAAAQPLQAPHARAGLVRISSRFLRAACLE